MKRTSICKQMVLLLVTNLLLGTASFAADYSKTYTSISEVSWGIYYDGLYLKIEGTLTNGDIGAILIENYSDTGDADSTDKGVEACYKQAMIANTLGKSLKIFLDSGQSDVDFGTLSESGVDDGQTMTINSTFTSNSSTIIYCTVVTE